MGVGCRRGWSLGGRDWDDLTQIHGNGGRVQEIPRKLYSHA